MITLERFIVALAMAWVLSVLILNTGRPLFTDDLWWHLRLGEVILQDGFPDRDPLLFTAVETAPFLHEWLFQVFVAGVEDFAGLHSLRLLHVVLGLVVIWAAYRFQRVAGLSRLAAMIGLVVFYLFAYQRLIQLRPQLLSMTFFFVALSMLIQPGSLRRSSIVGLIGLTALWANLHSIFVALFPFWGLRVLSHCMTRQTAYVRSHILALAGSLLAGLMNPRGPELYVFYFKHNAVNPAQAVLDDFGHYLPWQTARYLPQASLAANLMFAILCVLFAVLVIRMLRQCRRGEADPDRLSERIFLAGAGLLALVMMVYAIRFTWMIPIPFVYIAMELRRSKWGRIAGAGVRATAWVVLAMIVGIHHLQPSMDRFAFRVRSWADVSRYFAEPYAQGKFRSNAAAFLDRVGIGGNLYNPYALGGFLAWRLGPEYRTFIDGRQDRYPHEVFNDYFTLSRGGTGMLRTIRKYPFDFFFVPISNLSFRLRVGLNELGWARVFQDRQVAIYAAPDVFDTPGMRQALFDEYPTVDTGALTAPRAFNAWLEQALTSSVFTDPGRFDELDPVSWRGELNQAIRFQLFRHAEALARFGTQQWGLDAPEWHRAAALIDQIRASAEALQATKHGT